MNETWTDGWKERIYTKIDSQGFDSVASFLEHNPNRSFEDLAHELGGNDVAPIQLQWLFRDESKKKQQLDYYLVSTFVRYLARHVPNGIRRHGEWHLNLALGSWAGSMEKESQNRCAKIVKRFKTETLRLPDDWFPKNNDPFD